MLEISELRNDVLTHLGANIGQYTLQGVQAPALAVLPDPDVGYNYPHAGTTVDGIEVVILKPVGQVHGRMGNGVMQPLTWEVRLKQWTPSDNLIEMGNSLAVFLAQQYNVLLRPVGYIPPSPEGDSEPIQEQVVIRFTEYLYHS